MAVISLWKGRGGPGQEKGRRTFYSVSGTAPAPCFLPEEQLLATSVQTKGWVSSIHSCIHALIHHHIHALIHHIHHHHALIHLIFMEMRNKPGPAIQRCPAQWRKRKGKGQKPGSAFMERHLYVGHRVGQLTCMVSFWLYDHPVRQVPPTPFYRLEN